MSLTLIILILFFLFLIISLFQAYHRSPQKSLLEFLSVLFPIILSSITIYIGRMLLPQLNISYYIAGIGSIMLYFFLAPIITRETPDRYRKITKFARVLSCIITLATVWLCSSFVVFFIDLFKYEFQKSFQIVFKVLLIPMKILWQMF